MNRLIAIDRMITSLFIKITHVTDLKFKSHGI